MRTEQDIAQALLEAFPFLDGHVHVAREKRVFVDRLPQTEFFQVITYLHDTLSMTRGHNVVGTDEGEFLGFLYLVSGPEHIIVTLRTDAPKADPRIRSLTYMYPSFVLFERELVDLFGADVQGLPDGPHYPLPDNWPKGQWPLRKEWDPAYFDRDTMQYSPPGAENAAEPAPKPEKQPENLENTKKTPDAACPPGEGSRTVLPMGGGNLVTIPIGPQHPSLDEPGGFDITLDGERVEDAVIGIGYNHRGLEKACESRTYVQNLYIIERVCGICSHAHTTAYCMAVEQLAGITIPPRSEYIRLIAAELERLHSHLLWLGVAGHEIGFDTLFMLTWRDREEVLELMAVMGGNRINYGINCMGGVRRDIDDDLRKKILEVTELLEKEIAYFTQIATTDSTLRSRLSGVGVLAREDCLYFGAAGPVARASGICDDIRVLEPYGAYRQIPVRAVTDTNADVYGRTKVRLAEMQESLRLIRAALDEMPEGPISVKVPRRIPAGEAIIRVEAPRGEDIHYLRSRGGDMPDRVRVRAPTECNWHGMQHMLRGGYLSDVPITIAAIDPCYSCTDRAIRLGGSIAAGLPPALTDWKALRAYGIQFYRERGIDMTRVKL